ncbi:hypothetical protein LTS17_008714 [Exophiala oligosperma]
MALYTLRLRGQPKDAQSEMAVSLKEVDIFGQEQLTEHFLCDINPEGQVPVLSCIGKSGNIPDSLKMTFYMASKYPELMPVAHEKQIRQLLIDLHALNYFSLSFPGRMDVIQGIVDSIKTRLEDPTISNRYRKALEFKLSIVQKTKVDGLIPTEVTRMEQQARDLLASLDRMVGEEKTWIFSDKPTALDAHLVVFIARMTDVGRENIIPEGLRKYGARARQNPDWTSMMEGRKTMVPKGN